MLHEDLGRTHACTFVGFFKHDSGGDLGRTHMFAHVVVWATRSIVLHQWRFVVVTAHGETEVTCIVSMF